MRQIGHSTRKDRTHHADDRHLRRIIVKDITKTRITNMNKDITTDVNTSVTIVAKRDIMQENAAANHATTNRTTTRVNQNVINEDAKQPRTFA